MLDSTAAVAAERQGTSARQLLEAVVLKTADQGIAVSVITVLELAHGTFQRVIQRQVAIWTKRY